MKKFIMVAITLLAFTSCSEDSFKSGNMPLRQLIKDTTHVKSFNGAYFLIAGGISGRETDVRKIKMYVKANDEYNYKEFNLDEVKIKIDNTVKVPYITVHYRSQINRKYNDTEVLNHLAWLSGTRVVLVCSEKYLPEKLLEVGL